MSPKLIKAVVYVMIASLVITSLLTGLSLFM
ncbi:stressosome-associated protein Prli42 [Fictibacillus iocasae]|uniref:Stressosome-associated protein Prli42 n=1 Tax=Fictibacillus iocasae TaxID=2715437 RepID=A0ABW2NIZ9_9BACL|nr:stressosome-associated protein Prli42 [Fictibacillus aquaticus]